MLLITILLGCSEICIIWGGKTLSTPEKGSEMKIAKVILVLVFTFPFGTAHADQNRENLDVHNMLESCDLTEIAHGSVSTGKVL